MCSDKYIIYTFYCIIYFVCIYIIHCDIIPLFNTYRTNLIILKAVPSSHLYNCTTACLFSLTCMNMAHARQEFVLYMIACSGFRLSRFLLKERMRDKVQNWQDLASLVEQKQKFLTIDANCSGNLEFSIAMSVVNVTRSSLFCKHS